MREYREYQRKPKETSKHHSQKSGYIKKLIRQTIFSVVIFLLVCSPGISGNPLLNKIKTTAKSVLSYTVDAKNITAFWGKLWADIIPLDSNSNEGEKNENLQKTSEIL